MTLRPTVKPATKSYRLSSENTKTARTAKRAPRIQRSSAACLTNQAAPRNFGPHHPSGPGRQQCGIRPDAKAARTENAQSLAARRKPRRQWPGMPPTIPRPAPKARLPGAAVETPLRGSRHMEAPTRPPKSVETHRNGTGRQASPTRPIRTGQSRPASMPLESLTCRQPDRFRQRPNAHASGHGGCPCRASRRHDHRRLHCPEPSLWLPLPCHSHRSRRPEPIHAAAGPP